MRVEKIPVGEAIIETHIQGTGESVVLIPGMGVDVSMFDRLASRLNSAGYQTVAVNPRGIGESTGPLEGLTLHDFASDVAGVVEALEIAPAHMLGVAYGNRIARCFARDFQNLAKTVMLVSAGGLVGPDPEVAPIFQKLLQGVLEDMPNDEKIKAIQFAFFSHVTHKKDVNFPEKIWFDAIPSQIHAARTTQLHDWWDGGGSSMLVIQGLDDRIAPPANGRDLSEKFGDRVTLVELKDAGHAVLDEKPEAVAQSVIAFLRRH